MEIEPITTIEQSRCVLQIIISPTRNVGREGYVVVGLFVHTFFLPLHNGRGGISYPLLLLHHFTEMDETFTESILHIPIVHLFFLAYLAKG